MAEGLGRRSYFNSQCISHEGVVPGSVAAIEERSRPFRARSATLGDISTATVATNWEIPVLQSNKAEKGSRERFWLMRCGNKGKVGPQSKQAWPQEIPNAPQYKGSRGNLRELVPEEFGGENSPSHLRTLSEEKAPFTAAKGHGLFRKFGVRLKKLDIKATDVLPEHKEPTESVEKLSRQMEMLGDDLKQMANRSKISEDKLDKLVAQGKMVLEMRDSLQFFLNAIRNPKGATSYASKSTSTENDGCESRVVNNAAFKPIGIDNIDVIPDDHSA